MDKRGEADQYFAMFQIIIAAIIVLGVYLYAKNTVESTALEKEYLARDLALILDLIYASPGDLSYTYYMDKNKLDVKIAKGEVLISENGLKPAKYNYAENEDFRNPSFEMQKPKQLTFTKTGREIAIEGK